MIDPLVRSHIEAVLGSVAAEHGVRVLYAVESDSRAWGFASPDSDYDVRFIYAHPRDWYLGLRERRDVIERPLDEKLVDLGGWDLRKALRLLLKSNPVLYEWLVSPIVYTDGQLRGGLKQMFEAHASARTLSFHYWSIARSQWSKEIANRAEIKLKKYFYVIRPLLSLAWVAEHGSPPSMAIGDLVRQVAIPDTARAALDALLEQKRSAPELGLRPCVPALDAWIIGELDRLDPGRLNLDGAPQQNMTEMADALFRRVIGVES